MLRLISFSQTLLSSLFSVKSSVDHLCHWSDERLISYLQVGINMQQIISLQLSGYSHRTADRPHKNKIKTSSVAPLLYWLERRVPPSLLQQDLGQWVGLGWGTAACGHQRCFMSSQYVQPPASNLTLTEQPTPGSALGSLGRTSGAFPVLQSVGLDFNPCRKQLSLLGHKAQEISQHSDYHPNNLLHEISPQSNTCTLS